MLFDSTLRRELARNFVGTFVVILTVVLTIMFIRTLGQAALGRVSPQDVALLLAYIGLGNLSTMLALSLFVVDRRHPVAHVPGQRDDDLVRQRRAADALPAPGRPDQAGRCCC